MKRRSRALARSGAACVILACAVAGCGASGSGNASAVISKGSVLTIFLSEPSDFGSNAVAQDVVDAEQLAFRQQQHEVSRYQLQLVAVRGHFLSANARTAIEDGNAVAYLGELAPGDSEQTVGITNADQLLQVSPTDTALELGQVTRAVAGSPRHYFESWSSYGRTFGRVVPTSEQEAGADVDQMLSQHLKSLYIADDGSDYGRSIALAVRTLAAKSSIQVTSTEPGAAAIFYGAQAPAAGARFFNDAAKAAPSAHLFGSSSLDSPAFTSRIAASVRNLYISTPGVWPTALNDAAKSFKTAFAAAYHHQPSGQAIFGYAAMSAVLRVLVQAGTAADNRAVIARDFLRLRLASSVLGPFTIDHAGNTSFDGFVINRLRDGVLVPFEAAFVQR